jgi:capsular polysaccharide export protein
MLSPKMARMTPLSASGRRFLFLQGPHGPFFAALARALAAAGGESWRVGFNGGDRLFWRDPARFIPYRGTLDDWETGLRGIVSERGITDIVLYGETRPLHATAVRLAGEIGLGLHIFEEGYLRPWWSTYERTGSNGRSPLAGMSIGEMRRALAHPAPEPPAPADRWGDLREHMLYGAIYHGAVLLGRRPAIASHRDVTVAQEFRLYLRRLLLLPIHVAERYLATRRVLGGGFPFHLALLQLEHDPTFRVWSPFPSMTAFVETVIDGFAAGAPAHHHLVFKAHPLEDGRAPIVPAIRAAAAARGVSDRVHFLRGGKLAHLLAAARSAVTVNSTAAQQALWRGIPVKCFGRAVYDKPELVSAQPLPAFFAAPRPPDPDAYSDFRRFLVETSQVAGGFYSIRGRRLMLRRIVDLMLDPADPYQRRTAHAEASTQQLRLLR